MFQFPNGSIKRRIPILWKIRPTRFQFPNGSIKSGDLDGTYNAPQGFNSLMVRLKVRLL